ncbi:MAG TPA: HEAT repeat domain-containing protein [Candidatus Limnocylindrales bacterium]|nr:HEAT repeat domain-containing protein [Candidatus Limnocylindrales bacterium]
MSSRNPARASIALTFCLLLVAAAHAQDGARVAAVGGAAAPFVAPAPPGEPSLPDPGAPADTGIASDPEGRQTAPSPPRTLRQLASQAPLIATVRAGALQEREQGRIRVYPLTVERVVHGERLPFSQILLVELRGASTRPPLLVDAGRAVVLLRPLPQVSYLREHVTEAHAYEAVGGRDGVVPFAGSEQGIEVAASILRAREARTPQQIRNHAFSQLASSNGRLVEDAVQELAAMPALDALTQREHATLAIQLSNTSIPGQTRVLLMEALSRGSDRRLASLLAGAFTETARLLEAALRARARLGAPAGANELNVHLGSPDVGVRAAAVRTLAVSGHPYATAILADAIAEHEPRQVRLAAIDALGEMQDASALGALAAGFESDDRGIKQASARAILAKGDAADDALIELALRGTSKETRTYAAMLLLTRRPRTHPSVQRLASSRPSPDVLEVLEKGMQDTHAHEH